MTKVHKIFGALGTGKTEKLTNTFIEKVKEYSPETVMFATYTKAGAYSIKERLKEKDNNPKSFPYIGTMHSICSRMIGLDKKDRMDNEAKKEFCGQSQYEYEEEQEEEEDVLNEKKFSLYDKPFANACWSVISKCRANRIAYENWKTVLDDDEEVEFDSKMFLKFVKRYEEYKQKTGKRDYDDILQIVLDKKMVPPVHVIVFDEFQDYWRVLYDIYCMWKEEGTIEEIYLAGDPNQTIYTFMGANHEFFVNEPAIPETANEILKINYRCKKNIWDFSKRIMGSYSLYPIDDIVAKEDGGIVRPGRNFMDEAKNKQGEETLILTRTTHLANNYLSMLLDHGIPARYTIIDGKITTKFINTANFLIKLGSEGHITEEWESYEVSAFINSIPAKKGMLKKGIKTKFQKGEHKVEPWNYFEIENLFIVGNMPEIEEMVRLSKWDRVKHKFFMHYYKHESPIPIPTIRVGTMHSGKGMTTSSVIIINEMPDKIAKKWDRELEGQERRLIAMAVGRAKNEVIIVDGLGSPYYFLGGRLI